MLQPVVYHVKQGLNMQGVQGSAKQAESIEDLHNLVQNMPEIRKRYASALRT